MRPIRHRLSTLPWLTLLAVVVSQSHAASVGNRAAVQRPLSARHSRNAHLPGNGHAGEKSDERWSMRIGVLSAQWWRNDQLDDNVDDDADEDLTADPVDAIKFDHQNMKKLLETESVAASADYGPVFTQNHRDWAALNDYGFHVVRMWRQNVRRSLQHSTNDDDNESPVSSSYPAVMSGDASSEKPALSRSKPLSRQQLISITERQMLAAIRRRLVDWDWVCWMAGDTMVLDSATVDVRDVISEAQQSGRHLVSNGESIIDLIIQEAPVTANDDRLQGRNRRRNAAMVLIRNSSWSMQLLNKIDKMLSHSAVEDLSQDIEVPLSVNSALALLLRSHPKMREHVYSRPIVELWDSTSFLYLPKTNVLGFQGCGMNNANCLTVVDQVFTHLLVSEQTLVYRVAPYIQKLYDLFVLLYLLFALDRLLHILGLLRRKKSIVEEKQHVIETYYDGGRAHPFVAVQLPMFNESSCCQSIIDKSCQLNWPLDRLIIQVVDDSTNDHTKYLIDRRVLYWQRRGIPIEVRRRPHRHGFKAGALNEAMLYLPEEFGLIAIFDADFLPEPNFLRKTAPYFAEQPDVAFVQTRWTYTNAKESWLTRMQEISLNFHFLCEQDVRFRFTKFFNFNGTAGVWNRQAIDSVGGWHTDTLVEDTDLSLRTWAASWKSIYLKNVECLNEIPPTFSAYRSQQHRWTSGPMQVLKKAMGPIIFSRMPFVDKLFCFWFFLRNYVHVINFLYFLVLVPLMIWIPRVTTYDWAMVYLPAAVSMTNILFTPSEWRSVLVYVLFENAMCLFKACALVSGIFNIGQANHWTVTPKFARNMEKEKHAEDEIVADERVLLAKYSPIPKPYGSSTPDYAEFDSMDITPIQLPDSVFEEAKFSSFDSLPELAYSSAELSGSPSPFITATVLRPNTIFSAPDVNVVEESKFKQDAMIAIVDDDENFMKADAAKHIATAYTDTRTNYSIPSLNINYLELLMSIYLFVCFYYGFLMRQYGIAIFCICNATAYLLLAFNYIGRQH